ncbi:hypothetical protein ACJROX_25860 [Pseudalkalibacillus sp. A8]|uniref:hypothetical protein n=1 Tax=Pseudalkalibacillus sp. A8 TaxID=3382641 RepID=UPI0038B660E0
MKYHKTFPILAVLRIRSHSHPIPKGGLCPAWAFPFGKSVKMANEVLEKIRKANDGSGIQVIFCILRKFVLNYDKQFLGGMHNE